MNIYTVYIYKMYTLYVKKAYFNNHNNLNPQFAEDILDSTSDRDLQWLSDPPEAVRISFQI